MPPLLRALLLVLLTIIFDSYSYGQTSVKAYNEISAWLKDLQAKDAYTRNTAALGLDSAGANTEQNFKQLLAALRSKNIYVKSYAAYAIGNFQLRPIVAIPALISLFRDKNKMVREYACMAVTQYDSTAVKYLLDSISKFYMNSKYYRYDTVGYHIEFPPMSATTLYCVIALRHMDSATVVEETMKIKKIPNAIKARIYDVYIDNFWSYGFAEATNYHENNESYIDTSQNPYDFVTHEPVANGDTIPKLNTTEKNAEHDSFYLPTVQQIKRSIDSLFKTRTEENIAKAFCLLTNNDSLIPNFLSYYVNVIRYINIKSDYQFTLLKKFFLLASLQNAGHKAISLVPWLMQTLPGNQFDQASQYKAMGNIIANVRANIKINIESSNFESISYAPYNTQLLNEYIFSYYIENAGGLTKEEWYAVKGDILKDYPYYGEEESTSPKRGNDAEEAYGVYGGLEVLTMHDGMQTLEPFLEFQAVTDSNAVLHYNDSLTMAFLNYGFKSSNYKLVCLATEFCKYLDTIPPGIKEEIIKCLNSENLYVQEFAIELIIQKNIDVPFSDNLVSTYTLRRYLVRLFNDEFHGFFSGEGWPAFGAWGAGGAIGYINKLPWPPAPATARGLVDISAFKKSNVTVGTLYEKLRTQLINTGFPSDYFHLYEVPGGFALLTHIERIDADGKMISANRWVKEDKAATGFGDIFAALIRGKEGYFRSICFIISDNPNFLDNGKAFANSVSFEDVYNTGGFELPSTLKSQTAQDMYMNALVYEFYKKNGGVIRFIKKDENRLSIDQHLAPLQLLNCFK